MGKIQYELGKKFEEELCWYLSDEGYYVIYNEKNISGSQPVDIVAIKHNNAILIECKNLENKTGRFSLSRIEQNQWLAYKKLQECNNSNMIIAILWNDNVYFINFDLLNYFDKSINLNKIEPNIKKWSRRNLI